MCGIDAVSPVSGELTKGLLHEGEYIHIYSKLKGNICIFFYSIAYLYYYQKVNKYIYKYTISTCREKFHSKMNLQSKPVCSLTTLKSKQGATIFNSSSDLSKKIACTLHSYYQ